MYHFLFDTIINIDERNIQKREKRESLEILHDGEQLPGFAFGRHEKWMDGGRGAKDASEKFGV